MNKQAYYIYKVASINKLAADPKYTQEDFDRLVNEYKVNKRGDMPNVSTPDEMFNARLEQRQPDIDKANKGIATAVSRANGVGPWATGIGGMVGFGAGGLLSQFINGQQPDKEQYLRKEKSTEEWKKDFDKWKNDWWKRMLTGAALRGGGFLLGGAIPYLVSRVGEGAWDVGSAGVGAAYRGVRGALGR